MKKVTKVDTSKATTTGRGEMMLSWLDNEAKDKEYHDIKDLLKDFNEYYESIFNAKV